MAWLKNDKFINENFKKSVNIKKYIKHELAPIFNEIK